MSETKKQGKHTPGPWAIARLAEEVISPILSRNGYTGAFPIAARPEDEDSDETWDANARLIAAAPELLEALKTIVDAWLSPLEKSALKVQMCEDARAALAKAEGVQS